MSSSSIAGEFECRWEVVGGVLALREIRVNTSLQAAECVMQLANASDSQKYLVLARSLRAEALADADRSRAAAEARAALDLALRLDSPPLVSEAAILVARLVAGTEAEHARRIANTSIEAMAAPLPRELGRSPVNRTGVKL